MDCTEQAVGLLRHRLDGACDSVATSEVSVSEVFDGNKNQATSTSGRSEAAVAGDGVSVVEMRVLPDLESNFATGVHPDFEVPGLADSFDSAEFSVSNM